MTFLDNPEPFNNNIPEPVKTQNPKQQSTRRKLRGKSGEKYIRYLNGSFAVRVFHKSKQLYVCSSRYLMVAKNARNAALAQIKTGNLNFGSIKRRAAKLDDQVRSIIQEIVGTTPNQQAGIYLKDKGYFVAQAKIEEGPTHLAFTPLQDVALAAYEKGCRLTNRAQVAEVQEWALIASRQILSKIKIII